MDSEAQGQVLRALRRRLSVDPKAYGEPLQRELAGLWKLRVGDYRVIYRIIEKQVEVLVLKIGIRRDFEVYEGMIRRLRQT